jgi:hypothetical protein
MLARESIYEKYSHNLWDISTLCLQKLIINPLKNWQTPATRG